MDDPTTQLNYQIAEMIADTFGRSVETFDIELADQIIAKVSPRFTPTTRQLASEYRIARDAFLELDMHDEDAEMTEEHDRYRRAGCVLAEQTLFEIDRAKEEA